MNWGYAPTGHSPYSKCAFAGRPKAFRISDGIAADFWATRITIGVSPAILRFFTKIVRGAHGNVLGLTDLESAFGIL